MSITAERSPFSNYEHHRGFETSEKQRGSLRKRGALAVRNFFKSLTEGAKETFGIQGKSNRVTPAQQFSEYASRLRERTQPQPTHENVHIPQQRNGERNSHSPKNEQMGRRPTQEKAFKEMSGGLYDNIPSYGVNNAAEYRQPEKFAQPVLNHEGHQIIDQRGRHDSGEVRESTTVGRHSKEDQDIIGSPTWHQMEVVQEQPSNVHAEGLIDSGAWQSRIDESSNGGGRHSKDRSEAGVIGSPQWFHEQDAREKGYGSEAMTADNYSPHNNAESVIGSAAWQREHPAEPAAAAEAYVTESDEQAAWDRDNWRYIQGLNPNTKQPYEQDSQDHNKRAA